MIHHVTPNQGQLLPEVFECGLRFRLVCSHITGSRWQGGEFLGWTVAGVEAIMSQSRSEYPSM